MKTWRNNGFGLCLYAFELVRLNGARSRALWLEVFLKKSITSKFIYLKMWQNW